MRREKTIVLALVIQLFIAGFSSFLLVGLVSMYSPASVSGGGVAIGVTGDTSEDLIASIEGEGDWEVVRYDSETAARDAFERGRADTVFLTESSADGTVFVEALIPDESVRSTVIVVQVREALTVYERHQRAAISHRLTRKPIPVPDLPDQRPTFAFTYTVLLPLLMFLPVFISGSVAADTITEEIDAGTLELLRVTPMSLVQIIDGKMLAMIGLAPVQAAAWLGLLIVNGTGIANVLPLLGFVTASAVIVVGLGASLALLLETRQAAQLIYSLGIILVFLLAGLLPESPPNLVAKLAIASPSTISYSLVVLYGLVAVAVYFGVRSFVTRSIAG